MNALPNPRAVLASTYVRLGRYEAGLSVMELAERAGVTPETVRRIERGESVARRETLVRVLAALDPERSREPVAV